MRYRSAVRLGRGHQQRVELVEERGIGGQVRLEEGAGVLVPAAAGKQAMALEHPARVGVGHEDRPAGRVEQDRVGRLRPQAAETEQLAPQRRQRRPAERAEVAAAACEQPGGELEQPVGLEPVGAGGPDQPRQGGGRAGGQAPGRQQAARAQRGDRPCRSRPGGVLREDRADGDLERRAGRPPVLRAVMGEQAPVEPEQARLDRIAWRPGNPAPRGQHGTV
jgi:hypothetical protein